MDMADGGLPMREASVSVPMTGLILRLCPANERRCYFVTTSLIGWVQA